MIMVGEFLEYSLLEELKILILSEEPIKNHIDKIYEIRQKLKEYDLTLITNQIKDKVQWEVEQAFIKSNGWGAAYMATGTGKSKIGINLCRRMYNKMMRAANILICVPTERLRDNGWKEEFEKWGEDELYPKIKLCCYASLNKFKDETFDFVILDEGHNATENNTKKFFIQNKVRSCLMLTATEPRDKEKIRIFKSEQIHAIYRLSLDEAVKLGIVAPYDIFCISIKLDEVENYITGGTKKNPKMVTEKQQYSYLSRLIIAAPGKFMFIRRTQFIYGLRSKTIAAKLLLQHIIPKDIRTIIFCGNIEQAIELNDRRYFSKPTYKKTDKPHQKARVARILEVYEGNKGIDDFFNEVIVRLSCCEALNEGQNIPKIDCAFIVQLNSNQQDFVQRIGRILRYKHGHIGKIIILYVEDSVDRDWVFKSLKGFESSNIRWIELEELRLRQKEILFN